MSRTRQHYTPEFKFQVVLEVLREEQTVSEIAVKHQIHPNLITRWKTEFLEAGPKAVFDRSKLADDTMRQKAEAEEKEAKLYQEIGQLSTQLAWLKKNLKESLSRNERMALIQMQNSQVPIAAQAQLLSINRTSLYYKPREVSELTLFLRRRIDEIHTFIPGAGSRGIRDILRSEGIRINRKAVQNHMQVMGITVIYPGPNLSKRNQRHRVYPYLLRNLDII